MSYTTTINRLLYVPFNHDYAVEKEIEDKLTEDEFFNECFFMPDFDKEIDQLLEKTSGEVKAFEIDLTRDELITKYEQQSEAKEALENWISSNQNDLYCVKGDAGTGKSTFLHYMEYQCRNSDIRWSIIDIQKASEPVSVLGQTVSIPNFKSLYSKSIAAIVASIADLLYCNDQDGKIDFVSSADNLDRLIGNYKSIFEAYFLRKEVQPFYKSIIKVVNNRTNDVRAKCVESAEQLSNYIKNLFDNYNMKEENRLAIIIELYLSLLRCSNDRVRYMLAFDNFERFIGVDEIYNGELVEFVSNLRNIQNSISNSGNGLMKYYQIIIFMRKTSTRMFTSQQSSELIAHSLDLSEWFQISNIIEKKVTWYRNKNINIDEYERMLGILNDIGGNGNDFRGLRSKLNMLFNNNKRVITRFISKVLDKRINSNYIKQYDCFKNNSYNMDVRFSKFAARIIIFRLILNELRQDEFFNHIIVQKNNNESSSLGYARKILSILYEYSLRNEDNYMPIDKIIERLYSDQEISVKRFFDNNNADRRITVAQVLFYMNYYDTRSDNWLQFIDIQYNVASLDRIRIEDYRELSQLIDENHKNISIRITNAGMAYLYFVVYSFEYFACKSIYAEKKIKEFGRDDLPPLLCAIPTVNEIKNENYYNLTCMKILRIVSNEAFSCINIMNADTNNIGFRRNIEDEFILHKNRVINSHVGFIGNYIHVMRDIYRNELENDTVFRRKFERMAGKMEGIMNEYSRYK